jgi:hypothetical protein
MQYSARQLAHSIPHPHLIETLKYALHFIVLVNGSCCELPFPVASMSSHTSRGCRSKIMKYLKYIRENHEESATIYTIALTGSNRFFVQAPAVRLRDD